MVNMFVIIGVVTFFLLFSVAVGYWLWLKTRPHKETWKATVYELSDAKRKLRVDKEGKVPDEELVELGTLKPYKKDVIEKIEKEKGVTVFRLQKMNKPVPAIESDVVEYWGKDNRHVSVLYYNGTCTLLKVGYHDKTKHIVFNPIAHNRINMMKSEMAIRKDRLHKQKDILQAITPWIVAAICVLGSMFITYITVQGFIEISENFQETSENWIDMEEEITERQLKIEELKQGIVPERKELGKQDEET